MNNIPDAKEIYFATTSTNSTLSAHRQQYLYSYLNSRNNAPKRFNISSGMYNRDWRSALRTPPTYRIGNRTVRFNYHIALIVGGVCALVILFYYVRGSTSSSDASWLKNYASSTSGHRNFVSSDSIINSKFNVKDEFSSYNSTYPLSKLVTGRPSVVTFRIGMVADMDTNSKSENAGDTRWRSYIKKGYLTYMRSTDKISIKWDSGEPTTLTSSFSHKGRGMELSELVTFDGKILTFDDRTGLVYDITSNDTPIPWIILTDGNGHNTKGFKSEWATVKDRMLYVGSMGKEWTTATGEFENENPMYIKIISPTGLVKSLNWAYNFKRLREESAQITWPGYMIHESGMWSSVHNKWYFLPRRCSKEKYNETRDEHMGCNLLISADENFNKINTVPLESSNVQPTHGFSSFKFIPGTEDRIIIAIKTEELNGQTSTFITAFDIYGKILLAEQRVETELKYEGFEFI